MFYTYIGLVLFLTGVNVGFMPAGNLLGQIIADLPYRWIVVPIGMLIGYFISGKRKNSKGRAGSLCADGAGGNMMKTFQEFYKENDHAVAFMMMGKGTADSKVLDYFGLEASEKIVSFSVVTEEMWNKLKREMIVHMQIDIPGKGIAFIIPVSSIGGKKCFIFEKQDIKCIGQLFVGCLL